MSTITVSDGGGDNIVSLVGEFQTALIIELATGTAPTQSQWFAWDNYQGTGGSFASVVNAFIGSTAFADTYNNGSTVDPNATITHSIAQGIIENALGSSTAVQVDAWVDTGLSVAQVFQAFALSDQFTASHATQNTAIFFPLVTPPQPGNTFSLNGLTTFTDTGFLAAGDTHGGLTTSQFSMTTLSGALVGDHIILNNIGNELLANFGGGSSQVDVSSVSSLAQAIDLAAAEAPESQPGVSIPAQTGVVDWFQFGGNTYVVEAINPTTTPDNVNHLVPADAVIKLVGLIDLSHAQLSYHVLTL